MWRLRLMWERVSGTETFYDFLWYGFCFAVWFVIGYLTVFVRDGIRAMRDLP